jgi:glycerophosphoryl diester phosphodiesterase
VLTLALIVFALAVYLSTPMPEMPFFSQFDEKDIIVLAHQGGDGERPSNTLAAFEHAAELGAEVLEMDINSSSDGVLMVIHDATVDRTTNGTGRVNDLTVAEIQALDAGYHYPTLEGHELLGTGEYPYRGQGIFIPTLEEVFQAFPDYPMSIEIKQESPSIAQSLCDLIRQYGREDNTIVPSFSPIAMQEFRSACPEVPTAGVQSEVTLYYGLNLLGLSAAWQPSMHVFAVPEYSGDLHVLTPSFVNNTRQHNVVVYPWTINSAEEMQRMIDLGVDGIITDYPTLALEMLKEN